LKYKCENGAACTVRQGIGPRKGFLCAHKTAHEKMKECHLFCAGGGRYNKGRCKPTIEELEEELFEI